MQPRRCLVAATLAGLGCPAAALDNGLALTPPLGWRSWNFFQGAISDPLIRGQVDALLTKRAVRDCAAPDICTEAPLSLVELGYDHVGIDDGWQACDSYTTSDGSPAFHDATGKVNVNLTLFPDLKALTAYAAAKEVKLGWCKYTSPPAPFHR